jgi:hypothetical protein
MPPRQNPTTVSRRTTNFLTQAQTKAKPVEYKGMYPVYACPWEKLKACLERMFPGYQFDPDVCGPSLIGVSGGVALADATSSTGH